MRKFLLIAVGAALLAAAPLAASAPVPRHEERNQNDRHDDRRDDRRAGPDHRGPQRMNNRGRNSHVRACQQRYRSYNPRTDRYVVRPGVTRICRL